MAVVRRIWHHVWGLVCCSHGAGHHLDVVGTAFPSHRIVWLLPSFLPVNAVGAGNAELCNLQTSLTWWKRRRPVRQR